MKFLSGFKDRWEEKQSGIFTPREEDASENRVKSTPNRASRRAFPRELRRLARVPMACNSLHHPLLGTLTPHGRKVMARRRRRSKIAKASRKENR